MAERVLSYKRYLKAVFGVAMAGCLSVVALNWIIDPLQFYRKATYPPLLVAERRYQNPGLARNYEYDTAVIGTSMSENYEAASIRKRTGWRSLNLAMDGASAKEQRLMFEVAARSGRVKNVIWEINYEYLRGDPDWVSDYDGAFPFHLYNHQVWSEVAAYLLSFDTLKSSLRVILARCGLVHYPSQTFEELTTWYKKKTYGRESLARSWNLMWSRRADWKQRVPEFAVANLNANFRDNILAMAEAHPEVTFHLYFPPFSVEQYRFLQLAAPQVLSNMLANREYIGRETARLTNVRLYDFQGVSSIVANPDNYCDLIHFGIGVNEYIIDSIAAGRHRFSAASQQELRSLVTQPIVSTEDGQSQKGAGN